MKSLKEQCRGKQLPERIEIWCKHNEPAHKYLDIASKLIETFESTSFESLTGYEKLVWNAVTEGGYRK